MNAFAELATELKSEMLKASAESNERFEAKLLESNAQLDKKIQDTNTAILEDFFKRFDVQMNNKIDSSNSKMLKAVETQVTHQLKRLNEEIEVANHKTQEVVDEAVNESSACGNPSTP